MKISELKARLSAAIRLVRSGETVRVLDRETPVADLVPLEGRDRLEIISPRSKPGPLRSRLSVSFDPVVDLISDRRRR